MFLGVFLPLAVVCGFAFLVGIAVVVRETKMLKRAFIETPQTKPHNHTLKAQSPEELINAHSPYKRNSHEKPSLTGSEDILRANAFEQEEDQRWLAEISSQLNPEVAEDMDLLDTAKSLLELVNNKQRSASHSSKTITDDYAHQQKEFYKRFVEKKLSHLVSTRDGVRSR